MSSDLIFLKFLNKLSFRDRSLYLNLHAYNLQLKELETHTSFDEASKILSEFYNEKIQKLSENNIVNTLSEHNNIIQLNNNNEHSSNNNEQSNNYIKMLDKQFDEKLGAWEISSSSEESSS